MKEINAVVKSAQAFREAQISMVNAKRKWFKEINAMTPEDYQCFVERAHGALKKLYEALDCVDNMAEAVRRANDGLGVPKV